MEYIRTIEKKLNEIKNEYAVITIYGARQVGKTTTASKVFGKEMAVVPWTIWKIGPWQIKTQSSF